MIGVKDVTARETKGLTDLLVAGRIRKFRTAVDGGAHAGSWSAILARHFQEVIAIEPHPDSVANLAQNMADQRAENVRVIQAAIMHDFCHVECFAPGRTTLTATQVRIADEGDTLGIPIDSLDLDTLDFLKLDIEGAEYFGIQGAAKTIERCKPYILVESNNLGKRFGIRDQDVHNLIISMGYRHDWSWGVDKGYSPL